jgi:hypothetical protein
MATITPQTTYPDGAVLDVANHNANIYSVTPGRGIMSEPNGGLEQANLVTGFTVRAEHIMAEEAVLARADSMTVPMDVYSNGFGVIEDLDTNYVPVAGLCQRVYIPFNLSALVWEWSFFIAAFRPAVAFDDSYTRYALDLRVFIDGVEYTSMRRPVPMSAICATNTTILEVAEQVCANWYDFALLLENVTKGYHDIAVKLFMERPLDAATEQAPVIKLDGKWLGPDQVTASGEYDSKLHMRISFGTRSSRAIMFK